RAELAERVIKVGIGTGCLYRIVARISLPGAIGVARLQTFGSPPERAGFALNGEIERNDFYLLPVCMGGVPLGGGAIWPPCCIGGASLACCPAGERRPLRDISRGACFCFSMVLLLRHRQTLFLRVHGAGMEELE